jgi:beta-glucanase (GH16 family)
MARNNRLAKGLVSTVGMLSVLNCTSMSEVTSQEPAPTIDLAEFEPSFREDFNELDVSEWGCLSKWIAHTPWAGDFGSAPFMAPAKGFPFTTEEGIVAIKARRRPDGRWMSGMLSAWDACNSGYAQKYGYFETRARLPSAAGFWPAFWLIGVDKRQGTAEIDVFEFRTHEPDRYSLGILKHPAATGQARESFTTQANVESGLLSRQFNTYGVEVGPKEIVFYLNRKAIWRTPMREEFHQPMYPLLSLAVDTGKMDASTPDNVRMEVDYVHAYQRKPIGF